MALDTLAGAPAPRARREIHEKVKELVASLGLGGGKRALDAPLGPGAMGLYLHQAGYEVCGLDIDLEQSRGLPPAITRKQCNLNGPLPVPDSRFDLVTSLEGIEHVENHFHLVRELSRALKPGGHLILSTPNICSLEERLNFLVRGASYRFIPRAEIERHGSGFDHQSLINYVELRQVLDWAGLRVLRVEKDRTKLNQTLFLWPVYLLIKAYVALQSRRRRQKYLLDETSAANVLLGGNTIIFVARKV
jgi:cyclopropane fatty-acyl-phospholipid synthase-like methyltransferase